MFRFAPYVLKSLWRHRTRSALTVSGSAVALFVFGFVGAVQEGLARLTEDRQAERTLIVFQANRFCPSTSRLPKRYAAAIAELPGVQEVTPIKVYLNNCRASLDLIVFHGIDARRLRTARALEIVEGSRAEFEGLPDGALVGRAVARRRNLKVGDRFAVNQVRVTVAGIFASALPAEEHFIYTHLRFLQYTPGLQSAGTVTQFEVRLHEDADAHQLARKIDQNFHGEQVPTDTRPKGVFQTNAVGDLVELIGLSHYLGLACVGLVLALVATTTVMAVQDRIREHAVLQTLGFSGTRIFVLVLSESLLMSLAGGLLGIGSALGILAWTGLAVGTEGVTIAFQPSLHLVWTGLAVSCAVGVLAGIVPAWLAARADIVASLRCV